jgi:transcriptional regulator with XRE-family HTH domain
MEPPMEREGWRGPEVGRRIRKGCFGEAEGRAMAGYGLRMRVARELAGLKLEDCGEMSGLHKAQIHRWERGKQRMNLYQLDMWCQFIEVDPLWVLYGEIGPRTSSDMQRKLLDHLTKKELMLY